MQIIVVFIIKGTVTRMDATVSSTSRGQQCLDVVETLARVSHHPLRYARSCRARDRGNVGEGEPRDKLRMLLPVFNLICWNILVSPV